MASILKEKASPNRIHAQVGLFFISINQLLIPSVTYIISHCPQMEPFNRSVGIKDINTEKSRELVLFNLNSRKMK